MATIVERVAAGAAWMDKHVPGWADRIDLNRLSMADPCGCIRGQALGHYGNDPWPGADSGGCADQSRMADLGFDAAPRPPRCEEMREDDAALAAEWHRLVEARRAGAA